MSRYLKEDELQAEADAIMNESSGEETPEEPFQDSGSSYHPSSESDSSDENGVVRDEEHEYLDVSISNENDLYNPPVNERLATTEDVSCWTEVNEEPKIYDFTGIEGIKVNIPADIPAFKIFGLLFDDTLIGKICDWANLRAMEIVGNVLPKHSTMNRWKPLSSEEFRRFIGLCILMGQIKMPSIKCYWNTQPLYAHPVFGRTMSRNRFEQILRCLCFYKREDEKTSRLHKIEQVVEHVRGNIQKVYYPGKDISLDEALLLWRGRLIFRQYIPNKSAKYGIKLYELCTPDGYILDCLVYTGKGTVDGDAGHAHSVVTKLCEPYLDKGHTLYMDNYYNSVKLAEFLHERKTHVVGTLRNNRKGNPKKVISCKLRKGEMTFQRKGNVMVLKWKDKREVLLISTLHKLDVEEAVNKRGKKKMKPTVVIDYNKNMSGVDRSDQMLSYYTTPRKTVRWYLKVFFHFVDICLWNATHLYNQLNRKKLSFIQFRELIVIEFLQQAQENVKITPGKQHYPKKQDKRKRCRVCSATKKRTQTFFVCEICKDKDGHMIGLCVDNCFQEYHEGSKN